MIEINDYIDATCNPDLADLYKHSIEILDAFDLRDYEEDFHDLVATCHNMSIDQVSDKFRSLILAKLDYIIEQHMIFLNKDEVTLANRNEILDGLFVLQALDSYYDVLTILDSDTSDEEKVCEMLSRYCTLSSIDILVILDRVDSTFLDTVRQVAEADSEKYIYTNLQSEDLNKIVGGLKDFQAFKPDHLTLGVLLAKSGILLGQPLKTYIPHTIDVFKDKPNIDLAYHIYSLMLISGDCFNNPVLGFKEKSNYFFNDLNQIVDINKMINIINGELSLFLTKRRDQEMNSHG